MPEDHDLPELNIEVPERTVALTLDQIREGAQHLVVVARSRLAEVEAAIELGDFQDALTRAQELCSNLGPLATAEAYIGVFASAYLVRAADICEGIELKHWGRVTAVEHDEHVHGDQPCHHVTLSFENHEDVDLAAEQEVVAVRGDG